MSPADWSRAEVEATVSDYLEMLASELQGVAPKKSAHRAALLPLLEGRAEGAVEFKHANISAVLIKAGLPYIAGYKPRSNFQRLLEEVVLDQVARKPGLLELIAADAERTVLVPDVEDILATKVAGPRGPSAGSEVREPSPVPYGAVTNYLEREARNRALGLAGEEFVLRFERARLIRSGREDLAERVEHTAIVSGDGAGFDVQSFETSGKDRLIEVKTTKYGIYTPFFISRNELACSERNSGSYSVYRLFEFRKHPQFYVLAGSVSSSCDLIASAFVASPR